MNFKGVKLTKLLLFPVVPFAFFAALLFSRASTPQTLVFDEIHYVPAAKALITLTDNINWVHPPGAKYFLGAGWWILSDRLQLLSELTSMRIVAALFGLWALAAVRAWMIQLAFTPFAVGIAVWLTGFNFLWFVQSKIGMLDVFFLAFALWGTLDVWQARTRAQFWRGWIWLGLSMSCKWAAAPYFAIAFLLGGRSWRERALGIAAAAAVYWATFLPLAFLKSNPVGVFDFIEYHRKMLAGMDQIAGANHPYRSQWWQWVLLLRPMWYQFENVGGAEHCIWAGGNPALFWVSVPCVLLLGWVVMTKKGRTDRAARALTALYWLPLLFWVVVPRKLQMFYYYFSPAMFLGPIVVWAHERFYYGRLARKARDEVRSTQGWLLVGFTLLCALAFLYFLPIMDGRALRPEQFRQYMWLQSWI